MENNNYSATIEVSQAPEDVFNQINNVSKWWYKPAGEASSGKQTWFEGQSQKINDEFIIRSGDRHYSKQKVVELIPNKKVAWYVIDSKLNWLQKNKKEWTGTKMIFDIIPSGSKTLIRFTHVGLVSSEECYDQCILGWDYLIKNSLFNNITRTK